MIETKNEWEDGVLEEFQENTKDVCQDKITLIRFLKAREFNLEKAEKMLREAIEWRESNNIDSLCKWDAPCYLKEDLQYEIIGCDHDGGPVLWLPMGRWNARPWIEQGNANEILRWAFSLLEHALRCIKETKGGKHQITAIFGLEEISYYKAAHIESLKTLYSGFQILERCYPEILKRLIVINAPWVFNIPFNFIKGILSEHTKSKIQIFGSNKAEWLPHLLELAPKSSLPAVYFED